MGGKAMMEMMMMGKGMKGEKGKAMFETMMAMMCKGKGKDGFDWSKGKDASDWSKGGMGGMDASSPGLAGKGQGADPWGKGAADSWGQGAAAAESWGKGGADAWGKGAA